MTAPLRSLLPPRRSWWQEGAIIATAFALCLLGGVIQVDDTLSAPPVAAYVIALASCAVLPWRHRSPVAVMVATTVCGLLVAPLGLLLTPFIVAPAVITAYALAVHVQWRPTLTLLLICAALLVASTVLFESLSWQDASRMGAVAAFPLMAGVLGRSGQNRRDYLAAVEERARRAEESRESEAHRRVAEERVRIARELHDAVAHQITLASAQATVADHFFDTRPEKARESVRQLVETTGNALDDLRATVGLLRQTGDGSAPTEPAPGLSGLPGLVDSFSRAGLEVAVDQEGTVRALPPGLDLTAYRIIQEALTNVSKHAGTGSARVGLAWTRDRLTITVVDDGSANAGNQERAPGYGLIGMRERAAAVGGQLSAGRRPEGGFLVSTRLPLPPAKEPTSDTGHNSDTGDDDEGEQGR